MLVVVEGRHDVAFLQGLSATLHRRDPAIPDLLALTVQQRILWFPAQGELHAWVDRLAPLGCREWHLYDREVAPETAVRQALVDRICRRPGCDADLTSKRSLENFLHPDAIQAATSHTLTYGDHDSVPELLDRAELAQQDPAAQWSQLSRRNRLRRSNRAKRRLNIDAVRCMTPELLRERDPAGEVLGWLQRIAALATS